jgi:hypothetical protein
MTFAPELVCYSANLLCYRCTELFPDPYFSILHCYL